jgi:hypothetical protein
LARNIALQKIGKILDAPILYSAYQTCVGSYKFRNNFVKNVMTDSASRNYLDLGCAPAQILPTLIGADRYIGIDSSGRYIKKAKELTSKIDFETTFIKRTIGQEQWLKDIVLPQNFTGIALGLYHHMDDEHLLELFKTVFVSARGNSAIYSIDPIVDNETTKLAKFIAENDRGEYLRSESSLLKLIKSVGLNVEYKIVRNKLRIPLDIIQLKITPNQLRNQE